MIGSILEKTGGAAFPVVGAVHDALGGSEKPVASSVVQGWKDDENLNICYRTLMFYVGGTLVVGALLGGLLCKFLPMKKKRKPTRRRKTTTARRRTYRRKK